MSDPVLMLFFLKWVHKKDTSHSFCKSKWSRQTVRHFVVGFRFPKCQITELLHVSLMSVIDVQTGNHFKQQDLAASNYNILQLFIEAAGMHSTCHTRKNTCNESMRVETPQYLQPLKAEFQVLRCARKLVVHRKNGRVLSIPQWFITFLSQLNHQIPRYIGTFFCRIPWRYGVFKVPESPKVSNLKDSEGIWRSKISTWGDLGTRSRAMICSKKPIQEFHVAATGSQ